MVGFTRIRGRLMRRVVPLLAIVACGAAVAACGSSDSSDTSSASDGGSATASGGDKTYEVAFVPGVAKNPFYDTIHAAMEEEAAKSGIKINYQPPSAFDPTEQTKVLNAVLPSKPDLLIVSPTDPVALRAPIQRFMDAGIPVILVDLGLTDSSGIVSSILGDNEQGGQIVAEALAEHVGGKGPVATINIAKGFPTLDARVTGFKKEIEANNPDIEIVADEEGGATPASNQTKSRSLLLANPDLAGIFGVTEVNAEGAAAALKAVGKKDTYIAAFDATPTEIAALKDGTIQFLAAQDPRREGRTAIQFAKAQLDGDTGSIEKEIIIPAIGITKDNVDDPSVEERFYTAQ